MQMSAKECKPKSAKECKRAQNQERKSSPKRKFFWDGYAADVQGSFVRMSRSQTSVRPLKTLEKEASISAWTSMTRRRGRPRPQGIFKHFGQKNFGLNCRSLQKSIKISNKKVEGKKKRRRRKEEEKREQGEIQKIEEVDHVFLPSFLR